MLDFGFVVLKLVENEFRITFFLTFCITFPLPEVCRKVEQNNYNTMLCICRGDDEETHIIFALLVRFIVVRVTDFYSIFQMRI